MHLAVPEQTGSFLCSPPGYIHCHSATVKDWARIPYSCVTTVIAVGVVCSAEREKVVIIRLSGPTTEYVLVVMLWDSGI